MKYCHTCKRYRPDASAFCTQCGSSFDLKLCPRLHPNSTQAEYCHICGSSDLSTPHKRPKGRGHGLVIAGAAGVVFATVIAWRIVLSLPDYGSMAYWEILGALVCCAGLT